jgi:hypothetical protein
VETSQKRLIAHITKAEVHNAGCYLYFASEGPTLKRYIFFEDFSERAPLMNISGKDVRLRLVSSTEPAHRVIKKGDRFSRRYQAGGAKVRIDFVATGVCESNDEQCESTSYDATITATQRNRKQVVKTVGGCGS